MKDYTAPSILSGFMELLPDDQIKFNKMLETIKGTYERFGFVPIDTPVIEKSEILLAKSGGETEKQIYRFNKGDSDLSLRFDLTVPLARYVAQHFNSLTFPFRRYQTGKVFRGERAQKGRFREFYQCDIDIVGNETLDIINDAEILSVIYSTFRALGFEKFKIKISNRKVLNGFFEYLGTANKSDILRVIDKIGKIDGKSFKEELVKTGLKNDVIKKIIAFINIKGNVDSIITQLSEMEIDNKLFRDGINELKSVCGYVEYFNIPISNYMIDTTIARGLDYYTGTVYETFLDDYPSIGSVCSGGRYENLAQSYTDRKLPGVGISIGLTRLFYQLKEAGFITEENISTPTKLLVIPMEETMNNALDFATKIREAGIPTEIFFNECKFAKKFSYADKLGIPYVVVIGSDEIAAKEFKLKDMKTGEQKTMRTEDIINTLKTI
ncbi:MAG: histidine--tRNA ligase [Clostridia bacterium]|jgi:histidyl-tRNA synthetase